MTRDDERFMKRCLELARVAARAGETPVGSLIVLDGAVLAEASERVKADLDVTAHAEVLAIRRASALRGALTMPGGTLYSNVEPCILCSYAIRKASLARVVIGMPAGVLGGASSHHAILTEPSIPGFGDPPSLTTGTLEEDCRALFEHPL